MSSLILEAPPTLAAARERQPAGSTWLKINGIALIGVAIFLRCWHLGNIPGVNGDEAWSGVQALLVLRGDDINWHTPTGNPINPFFLVPQIGLHYFFAPSIVLLRITSLVSGLVAILVNYVLCRRAFDERTAVVSTLLIALLPIDIAYSRFAWDASQSLLATLLVVYLPLVAVREWGDRATITAAAIFACAAAVLVHPTNVFAVVFLIVPALYVRRLKILEMVRSTAIPTTTWTLAAIVVISAAGTYLAWQWAPAALARLQGPDELGTFAANYLRLFSGAAVYQFISGAGSITAEAGWFAYTQQTCNLAFGLVVLLALSGVFRRVKHSPSPVDACLVVGWMTMLAGFFLAVGPAAIAPHVERYGICLIAPGTLVVARGLAWWIEWPRGTRFAVTLAIAAWLWPVSFYVNYFQCFLETGGLSHNTFRTAAVEPKRAALEYILAARRADEPAQIICRDWWNYWPVAYLAFHEPNMRLLTGDEWRRAAQDNRQPGLEETWFIEFAATTAEREIVHAIRAAGKTVSCHTILDYGRRPIVSVIGPVEKFSQNY